MTPDAAKNGEMALRRHQRILAALPRVEAVHEGRFESALRTITELASEGLEVDRVGVWLFDDDHSVLRCVHLYEGRRGRHGSGGELAEEDCPAYFRALRSERKVNVEDVANDPRTAGFFDLYSAPLEIGALLDAPIRVEGEVVGVVCHEELGSTRRWSVAEENLAASIADHVALAVEARDRRKAEEALRESRATYRNLIESLPLGIVVHREREITYANPGAASIVGTDSPEDLVGRTILDFVHPDYREEAEAEIRRVEEERRISEVNEYRAVRSDGRVIIVEAWAIPVTYEEAPAVQTLVRDITVRKETEEALRASERRFRTLFQDSRDAIYFTRANGEILNVNDAGCRLFRGSRDELRGLDAKSLYADPDDRRSFQEAISKRGSVKDFDVKLQRLDGTEMDCLLTSTERRDGDGELRGYQGIIRDVTERKRFEEQLQHRALHDWLTDLPNRALFRDRLEHAVARVDREEGPIAVMFLDIDRFKVINDGLGHQAGDRVLVQLGQRIHGTLREEDTVARMGGDEFAVLLEKVEDADDAVEAGERVARALEQPFRVAGDEVHVSASIGIAYLAGGHEDLSDGRQKADDLLRRADAAMYRVKAQGGTGLHVFDPDVDVAETTKLKEENELRRALENEEFTVYYQPVVDLRTGRICAVEPLARWFDAGGGSVPPREFIPRAEETGLIKELGEWLLERACRDLLGWGTVSPDREPLQMSANISPRQFEDYRLEEGIRRILDETGYPAGRLSLEVTETAVMHTPERVDALRDLGVGLAVDDFGTGYSSLNYLKTLDVDALKIDRSFMAGMQEESRNTAIVRTIITLGRTLDLEVVGEGVESGEQCELLRSLGCHKGQGFYFARPMPADEMERLLADDPSW